MTCARIKEWKNNLTAIDLIAARREFRMSFRIVNNDLIYGKNINEYVMCVWSAKRGKRTHGNKGAANLLMLLGGKSLNPPRRRHSRLYTHTTHSFRY